ncbi:MAG TPA: DEAD/DEAH box helicase family protein [Candidatus Paceibacterota bacterium]|nr:DEAD/DEAH box helicase family protein [Candidatus Paceibacterota bacterium]
MPVLDLAPQLRISYRSGRDDLVRDFYVPCLERAVLYRRAVGYFTSSGLAYAARGVASLVQRKGQMRLVASPYLEDGDLEALRRASDRPDEVLRCVVLRSLGEIEDYLVRERLNALAWLIAEGALEVRLALRLDNEGHVACGLYHEKVGIFTDEEGNHVAFAGSANETVGGLVENFESIKVFWSWDDPQGRVAEEISNFEALWTNQTPGLRVLDFTRISHDLLRKYQLTQHPQLEERPRRDYRVELAPVAPGTIPASLTPREYQKEAMRAWLAAQGRGILAMATGAGKTLTALYLACKLLEKTENRPMVILVVCPFLNLAYQWIREMGRFGIAPVQCFESRALWEPDLQEAYQKLAAGLTPVVGVVVTNKTFLSASFQSALKPALAVHLLIADEVHNLGAPRLKELLPQMVRLRLGLSATPERHRDAEGSKAIFDYFGDPVYEFNIANAIRQQVLVPYLYHPVLVVLTDEETVEYIELTDRILRLFPKNDDDGMSDALKLLLIKRARLLASAANKLPALRQIVQRQKEPLERAIVYCGDGSVECPLTDELERQIIVVTRILGDELGLRVRRFTCEESGEEREEIITALKNRDLNAVVAIRCLTKASTFQTQGSDSYSQVRRIHASSYSGGAASYDVPMTPANGGLSSTTSSSSLLILEEEWTTTDSISNAGSSSVSWRGSSNSVPRPKMGPPPFTNLNLYAANITC